MRSIYQAANSSEWTPGDSTVPLGHGVPGKLQQMDYIHTNKYIYTLYLYTSLSCYSCIQMQCALLRVAAATPARIGAIPSRILA